MRRILCVLLAAAGPALAQDLPPAIAALGAESAQQCTDMGGAPRIGPAFATAVDLNGDGRLDHVVDLAGIECVNAWSALCGSAGCPVSIWIDGPNGSERKWSDYAQSWTLDGAGPQMAVVVTRHGSACPGAASGADSCTERLTFGADGAGVGTAAPADAAPAHPAPAGPGWTLRAAPEGGKAAVSQGAGPVASLALFCLGGEPFLAATWRAQPGPEAARLDFGFSGGPVSVSARREEGAGGALVASLRGQPLAARLAGKDVETALSVDGKSQGKVSLKGSTRAIRGALASCGGA